MASPISPGDVLEIAKGVYKLYKRFKDAPKEMNQLREQLQAVTTILRQSDNAIMQLDFLKTPDGKDLLKLLYSRLRKLKKILRQIRNVGKQWQRAQENWLWRPPFVLYTMRAIPGLQADLDRELNVVKSIKTEAFQIGVPAALKQLQAMMNVQKQKQKSQNQDEFTATEQKRRKACSALQQTADTQSAASTAEQKKQILTALGQSGLGEEEAQKLLDLYIQEKDVAAKNGIAPGKGIKPPQRAKSFPIANNKPKVQVIVPKNPAKPEDKAKKANSTAGSVKTGTNSYNTKKEPKDDKKKPEKAKPKPKIITIKNNNTDDKPNPPPKKPGKDNSKPKVVLIKNKDSDSGKTSPKDSFGKGFGNPKATDKGKQKDQENRVAQALALVKVADTGKRIDKPKTEKKTKDKQIVGTNEQSEKQANEKKAGKKAVEDAKEQKPKKQPGKKQQPQGMEKKTTSPANEIGTENK